MRLFQWPDYRRWSRQHLIAVLLLVAAIVALVPIPFRLSAPVRSNNGKDHSRPFPCQDRTCGCRTAEQCRRKCCCFTAQQKLAWAKLHGIPASEVVAAATEINQSVKPIRPRCCSQRFTAQAASRLDDHPGKSRKFAKVRYKVVMAFMAQECQGVAQNLFGQSMLVLPPTLSLKPIAEVAVERLTLSGIRFDGRVQEPPVPPPRLIAA